MSILSQYGPLAMKRVVVRMASAHCERKMRNCTCNLTILVMEVVPAVYAICCGASAPINRTTIGCTNTQKHTAMMLLL
jgi:hypothetical protein